MYSGSTTMEAIASFSVASQVDGFAEVPGRAKARAREKVSPKVRSAFALSEKEKQREAKATKPKDGKSRTGTHRAGRKDQPITARKEASLGARKASLTKERTTGKEMPPRPARPARRARKASPMTARVLLLRQLPRNLQRPLTPALQIQVSGCGCTPRPQQLIPAGLEQTGGPSHSLSRR